MLLGKESLDLRLTLMDSAQSFSWTEGNGGYCAVIAGKSVCLYREKDGIHAETEHSGAYMRAYLDLDRDYGAVAEMYADMPQAVKAFRLYPGLRVLNQDPWETLVSFILSANNNVRRIRGLVDRVCNAFGPRFFCGGGTLCGFPSPEKLASVSENELRALGTGYRAPFLTGAARMVADGFPLYSLKDIETAEARKLLLTLPGVGDKVASCVLLFGCGHADAFPVDVWVERLLRCWYGVECRDRRKQRETAEKLLGENAGILQQFLFQAARTGDIEL